MTSKILPYLKLIRLHRPLPILLSLWPALWGLWLAAGGFPGIKLLVIFILGSFLTRSAGCIFNDLSDRPFDGSVKRTQDRPLINGSVSSRAALTLAMVLCLFAFALICLTNRLSLELSFIAVALMLIYPWMKRLMPAPQLVLGLAFNFGLLLGFSAVQGKIPLIAWAWYLSAILWTLIYDTYYAMADQEDDAKLGLKSTALYFGKYAIRILQGLQGLLLLFWMGLFYSYWNLKLILIFLLIFLSFLRQNRLAQDCNPLAAFSDNHWVGLLIWVGLVLSLPH